MQSSHLSCHNKHYPSHYIGFDHSISPESRLLASLAKTSAPTVCVCVCVFELKLKKVKSFMKRKVGCLFVHHAHEVSPHLFMDPCLSTAADITSVAIPSLYKMSWLQ